MTKSLYDHFIAKDPASRVLDLGCGEGLFVHELMKSDERIDATLVDASSEMLGSAKQRLADFESVEFVRASFQELLKGDLLDGPFDFVLSSFSIHHLEMEEKEALFGYFYDLLNPGGFFLVIDVVAPPSPELEDWYLRLWRDWIDANVDDSVKGRFLDIPLKHKDDPDDHPDTLSAQLGALKKTGFENVDCHHKFGIFAMFGGSRKP